MVDQISERKSGVTRAHLYLSLLVARGFTDEPSLHKAHPACAYPRSSLYRKVEPSKRAAAAQSWPLDGTQSRDRPLLYVHYA